MRVDYAYSRRVQEITRAAVEPAADFEVTQAAAVSVDRACTRATIGGLVRIEFAACRLPEPT